MSMIRTITVSLGGSGHSSAVLRIQDVAQHVAEHVEGQDDREDRQARIKRHPWRLGQIALRGVQHAAPRRRRRLLAQAEERQAGLGDDRGGDRQARLDHERRQHVGKNGAYAETSPRGTLASTAIVTGMSPARSEARAPQISRASTSRPTSSVPRRWSADGALRTAPKSVVTGSNGASQGAVSATTTNALTTARAAAAAGRRRSRPAAEGRRATVTARVAETVLTPSLEAVD